MFTSENKILNFVPVFQLNRTNSFKIFFFFHNFPNCKLSTTNQIEKGNAMAFFVFNNKLRNWKILCSDVQHWLFSDATIPYESRRFYVCTPFDARHNESKDLSWDGGSSSTLPVEVSFPLFLVPILFSFVGGFSQNKQPPGIGDSKMSN